MDPITINLILQLGIILAGKFGDLQALLERHQNGEALTEADFKALDLQDDAAKKALQDWIDSK